MGVRVLGVLAGEVADARQLGRWADSADIVLAADGGADHLLAVGVKADVLVGDLDSVSAQARQFAVRVVHVPDQDRSDCDKLLGYAEESGFQSITLIAAAGRRVDHMLGTLFGAARSRLNVGVAYDRQYARVLKGPVERELQVHGLLSLMPLGVCEGVTLEGVRWPLRNSKLEAQGLTSLSNQAEGLVRMEIRSGAGVLFVDSDGKPFWDDEP